MPEVAFYHLSRPFEATLPRLLERIVEQGHRVAIRAADPARLDELDKLLWTYDDASFLPHGRDTEEHAAEQPILLTEGHTPANGATVLIVLDPADPQVRRPVALLLRRDDTRQQPHSLALARRPRGYGAHLLAAGRAREMGEEGVKLCTLLTLSLLTAASPRGPEFRTSDVDTFYRIYDRAGGHPAAAQLQSDYIDAGSAGLREFAKLRNISGTTLADAINKTPATFSGARRCVAVLPGVRGRLAPAFAQLASLYPAAKFPPVTVVIGRGKTGGTTSASGVLIGLETLCASDFMDPDLESRFVHLIAHEYVHVQQPLAQVDDPKITVLTASLIEGGAEFVGELISGDGRQLPVEALDQGP